LSLICCAVFCFSARARTGPHPLSLHDALPISNAALDGLVYTPAANFNGADTLTLTTNDQGNTGSGGAKRDTDMVAITVNAVNDADRKSTRLHSSHVEDS